MGKEEIPSVRLADARGVRCVKQQAEIMLGNNSTYRYGTLLRDALKLMELWEDTEDEQE